MSLGSRIGSAGGGPSQAINDGRYLEQSLNLSDLASASTARSNLGLGSLATLNSIDISSNTNLAVTSPIVLTGDTLSFDQTAQNTTNDARYLKLDASNDPLTGDLLFDGNRKIIGGTGTTSDLTLQTTSGVGASGADMHFLVGNNGATEAMTILNSGNVGIGTTSPLAKLTIKQTSGSTEQLLSFFDNNNNTRLVMYSTGSMDLVPVPATVSATSNTSSIIQLYRSRWTGSASATEGFAISHTSYDSGVDRGALWFSNADSGIVPLAISHGATGQIAMGNNFPSEANVANYGQIWMQSRTASNKLLTIQGASSQSANLTEWLNSSATVLSNVSSIGGFESNITVDPTSTTFEINDFTTNFTGTGIASNSNFGTRYLTNLRLNAGVSARTLTGMFSNAVFSSASSGGLTGGGVFISQAAQAVNDNGSQTVSNVVAINALAGTSRSGGTSTAAYGFRSQILHTGTVTSGYGFYAQNDTGAGTLTTQYGLYVESLTGGATNYALFTNSGLNELNDQLFVDGSADRIQLIVQANATQTANLVEYQNSSSTVLSRFGSGGNLVLETGAGTDASFAKFKINDLYTNPASSFKALRVDATLTSSTNPTTVEYRGLDFFATLGGNANWSNQPITAGYYVLKSSNSATTGNLRTLYTQIQYEGSGTLSDGYNYYIDSPTNLGGGTVTRHTGIHIQDITSATTNYAIRTNAGLIVFNEGGNANTDIRIEGDTDQNLLFTDASADFVGVGTNAPNSKLQVSGPIATAQTTQTTTYTIAATDSVIACNSATGFTVTLPTAVGCTGRQYTIKNINTGLITLDGNGSETIDSLLTQSLSQNDAITVVSNGTGWWII